MSWAGLFSADTHTTLRRMRVVRRGGRDFLVLPAARRAGGATLALYAPQSNKAKLWKLALGAAMNLGVPVGGVVEVAVGAEGFGGFLRGLTGAEPDFGILCGNPLAVGQRFIFLLSQRGEPAVVVKAGASPEARTLLAREADFLAKASALNLPGVVKFRARFDGAAVAAVATDFLPGESPSADADAGVAALLERWILPEEMPLGDVPALQCVGVRLPGRARVVAMHGDFAPWNVKVWNGAWTALDWERGEVCGVPGWDWLHWVVQHAVLVRRESAAAVSRRLEALLGSECFRAYARTAGVDEVRRTLAGAYLRHFVEVVRPTEGSPVCEELARGWV